MGDRLECTDTWQAHHDRVTAEIPVVVSDGERHDMFWSQPVSTEAAPVTIEQLCSAVLPEGDDD